MSHAGQIVAHYEYSPFGAVHEVAQNQDSPVETGEKAYKFNFRFSTKYADAETQLSYYGYRYYDAQHGSWLDVGAYSA